MARRSSVIKVSILGDASQLDRTFGDIERRSQSMEQRLSSTGASLTRNVTLPLLAAGAAAFKMAGDQEQAEAKLNAVIKSTGGVAGITAGHVKELAASLQDVTTFGDEATIAAANVLLTFKNLRNEVGQGNDIFDRTTKIVLDMSTALDMDLKSSAIQLGKALNDPITGLSMLTRVGITFTEAQQDQIKALQESGDLMGAQRVILEELESQFQGTARAVAQTSTGQLKQAMNAVGDAAEALGTGVAPAVVDVANAVKSAAESFQELPEGVQEGIVKFGLLVAAAGPVLTVIAKMITLYKNLRIAAAGAAAAQAASAAGGVAGGAGAAAGAAGAGAGALLGGVRAGTIGAGAVGIRAGFTTSGLAAGSSPGLTLAAGAIGSHFAEQWGQRLGEFIRQDVLGREAKPESGFTDSFLLSGGSKRQFNEWFGWFQDSRIAGEEMTTEHKAAAWQAQQLAQAESTAAQRAFLMSEHLEGAGSAAQTTKKPLTDLAGAAGAAAEKLGLLGSGQDAFNRLVGLLEEGNLLRSVGLDSPSVDEALRGKAALEAQGFDTGRLGRGDTFNFDVTVTTVQTAEAFARDMEEIARRRRAEVVGSGAN